MSRRVFYYDDVFGMTEGYITNDDSDKIIKSLQKAIRKYKKANKGLIQNVRL